MLANRIRPFMLHWTLQRPVVTQHCLLLGGRYEEVSHRSWNTQREHIWIFYFWVYQGDNLFFYRTFTCMCGYTCRLLQVSSLTALKKKKICKVLRCINGTVFQKGKLTVLSELTGVCVGCWLCFNRLKQKTKAAAANAGFCRLLEPSLVPATKLLLRWEGQLNVWHHL